MGKGGNRYGAGRPAHRQQAELMRRLDLREWRRHGIKPCGVLRAWRWNLGGEPHGSVGFTWTADVLRLSYSVGTGEGHWRNVSQAVTMDTQPCRYGGARSWFRCPHCGARALVLFFRWERFACRGCQRVSYRSQSGGAADRAFGRYHALASLVEAPRPKWQRLATRQRLIDRYVAASIEVDRITDRALSALGVAG